MNRTLVIGDIHGGLKALKQVFDRAGVTVKDRLIFLGDYVDGWSESAGVIDYLLELSESHQCIFIKGNHDAWCSDWLNTHIADRVWLANGGKTTMESYTRLEESKRPYHVQFFERLKLFEIDTMNRLFVHAGFSSELGPENEPDPEIFAWDRSLWQTALVAAKKKARSKKHVPERFSLFHEVFIGHTPTLYYNSLLPLQACNVWNVDTGAGFTGKLSLMDVDTKEFWQSDFVSDLYPSETGRNW